MSALLPSDPNTLSSFPMGRTVMFEIFGCAGCHKIPDPDDYFIREGTGEHICSECAVSVERRQKGPPHLLKTLLMNCKWECKYAEGGCIASILGSDWASHVDLCKYSRMFCCKFYGCEHQASSPNTAVSHLLDEHQVKLLHQGSKTILCIPFGELILAEAQRVLALIIGDHGHYLFCSQICDNNIWMWIWTMHAFDYDDGQPVMYKLKLEVDGKTQKDSNSNAGLSFIGTCLPYKFTAREVISDESCLSISFGLFLKRYLKSDEQGIRTFTVKISISNKPSEFESM